jgi:hypothetical protein
MGGWSDRNSERGADFDFYAMAAGRRAGAPSCAPKFLAFKYEIRMPPRSFEMVYPIS